VCDGSNFILQNSIIFINIHSNLIDLAISIPLLQFTRLRLKFFTILLLVFSLKLDNPLIKYTCFKFYFSMFNKKLFSSRSTLMILFIIFIRWFFLSFSLIDFHFRSISLMNGIFFSSFVRCSLNSQNEVPLLFWSLNKNFFISPSSIKFKIISVDFWYLFFYHTSFINSSNITQLNNSVRYLSSWAISEFENFSTTKVSLESKFEFEFYFSNSSAIVS